jgi:hypothetical protein
LHWLIHRWHKRQHEMRRALGPKSLAPPCLVDYAKPASFFPVWSDLFLCSQKASRARARSLQCDAHNLTKSLGLGASGTFHVDITSRACTAIALHPYPPHEWWRSSPDFMWSSAAYILCPVAFWRAIRHFCSPPRSENRLILLGAFGQTIVSRNENLVKRIYMPHDADKILKIGLPRFDQEDFISWTLNKHTTGMTQYAEGQRLRRRPNVGAVGVGHGPCSPRNWPSA